MKQLSIDYPIRELCSVLGLSRSGYYQWCSRTESARARASRVLIQRIADIHRQSLESYGSPRVTHELRRQGLRVGKNRVARLMRSAGLKAKRKRPFRPRTTDSRHDQPIAANHLKAIGAPAAPDTVWVADITYLRAGTRWLYLAAVMDLFSRKIIGWSLSDSLDSTLVKEALKQALASRRPAAGLLHHSDRGVQYASSAFRALLASWRIVPSMSGLAHCYDNAAMEAFWSSLKNELVHHCQFEDSQQARLAIFQYIELFYNRKRLHSALGYQSPVDFENQFVYKNN
jgi:transposase InsO family protein